MLLRSAWLPADASLSVRHRHLFPLRLGRRADRFGAQIAGGEHRFLVFRGYGHGRRPMPFLRGFDT